MNCSDEIMSFEKTNLPRGSIRERYNEYKNCFEMQMACELEPGNVVWLPLPALKEESLLNRHRVGYLH